jgi:hypothetical protein
MDFAHSEYSQALAETLNRFMRDDVGSVESIIADELTGSGHPHCRVAARNSSLEGSA